MTDGPIAIVSALPQELGLLRDAAVDLLAVDLGGVTRRVVRCLLRAL